MPDSNITQIYGWENFKIEWGKLEKYLEDRFFNSLEGRPTQLRSLIEIEILRYVHNHGFIEPRKVDTYQEPVCAHCGGTEELLIFKRTDGKNIIICKPFAIHAGYIARDKA